MKEIFKEKAGKWSGKRVIGAMIVVIAIAMAIDAHVTDRVLNITMFNSMLYTGGIMIVGGVLDGAFAGKSGGVYDKS